MPTALQTLNLKAMSLASGYGKWTASRTSGELAGRPFGDSGGTFIDRTPRRVPIYNHGPVLGPKVDGVAPVIHEPGHKMATGSFSENYLYEKGLKMRWYAWPPGEECMSRTFTAAWVEKLRSGANALKIGASKQGCEICRQEPLAGTEKTPTQMTPEITFGVTTVETTSNSTPFRDEPENGTVHVPAEPIRPLAEMTDAELQAELTRRAEAEVTAPALTEESRAAVGATGAPIEPTVLTPSVQSQPTPPAATKLELLACPECERPAPTNAKSTGKPLSLKQRYNAVRTHMRVNGHTDTVNAVPA